jgi:hypothetical protein
MSKTTNRQMLQNENAALKARVAELEECLGKFAAEATLFDEYSLALYTETPLQPFLKYETDMDDGTADLDITVYTLLEAARVMGWSRDYLVKNFPDKVTVEAEDEEDEEDAED